MDPTSNHDEHWQGPLADILSVELSEAQRRPLAVLEAGGGSATFLSSIEGQFEYTTIDISPEQLRQNSYAKERILGDLEQYSYGSRKFDVIICFDVIEHLKQPLSALDRLLPALAPGGVMIIKGPIPQSAKGIITRLTPHFVHVLFYRWVLGSQTAGKPGHAPFPAVLSSSARPDILRDRICREGIEVIAASEFETSHIRLLRRKSTVLYYSVRMISAAMQLVSAGRYGSLTSDFYLIARRPRAESTLAETG